MGNGMSSTNAGFGPLLAGANDFTQLFAESIFTTAPAIIALVAAILRLLRIRGKESVTHGGLLLWAKLLLGTTLAGVHIAALGLYAVMPAVQTGMTLPAASFSVAASLCIISMLFMEHIFSYQPSTFLSLYFSITWLLDVAKTYSCFHRGGPVALRALYILSCVTRFLLLATQEISKRQLIRDEQLRKSVSPESASGFWNRAMFAWINSTLLLGYRQTLTVEDLPPLAPQFHAENLFCTFKVKWDKGQLILYRKLAPMLTTRSG